MEEQKWITVNGKHIPIDNKQNNNDVANEINNLKNQLSKTTSFFEKAKIRSKIIALERENSPKKEVKRVNKKEEIARQKEEQLKKDYENSTELQKKQFEIIKETNPMLDDYHTGIRSPKDIKTFSETLNDDDSFQWGDFTKDDAQKALKEGYIIVYSSKGINNGDFVSTSLKQAKEYAGSNQVYSKKVKLTDVAWINGDEGQFAKIETPEEKRIRVFGV